MGGNVVTKQKYIMTVAVFSILTCAMLAGGFFLGRNISRGETVRQFLLTQDVSRGHELKGKFKEVNMPLDKSVNPDDLITSQEQLEQLVAYMDMYKNQPITKSAVGKKDDIERNLDFAMPITVEGAIANSAQVDDLVAIKVKFQDDRADACVVPSINIADIKTSQGEPIVDSSTLPGFFLFNVTDEESADLNAASKEGSLYIVRYRDTSQQKLEKTYQRGQQPVDSAR